MHALGTRWTRVSNNFHTCFKHDFDIIQTRVGVIHLRFRHVLYMGGTCFFKHVIEVCDACVACFVELRLTSFTRNARRNYYESRDATVDDTKIATTKLDEAPSTGNSVLYKSTSMIPRIDLS